MVNRNIYGRSAALAACAYIIAALLFPSHVRAQRRADTTYGGMVFGVHGFGRTFAEVGLARLKYIDLHDAGDGLSTYSTSVMISPGDRLLVGMGLSGWYEAVIFGVGWSFTYYSDLHDGTFRFSPQFMLALDRFSVGVAPIIPLTNPDFVGIPKGEFLFRWTLPMWGTADRHR